MKFEDIKTFTYIQNLVSINGLDYEISTFLLDDILAVQYHKSSNQCLEELADGTVQKCNFIKYESIFNEWLLFDSKPYPFFHKLINNNWIEDSELKNEYEKTQAKEQKEKELNELIIDHNTVLYDANGEALGNMATVIAIANATFNRAISVGIISGDSNEPSILSLEAAYIYVYKNQTVTWKGADNKPHKVQLESLVEASQKAMTEKSKILFKY